MKLITCEFNVDSGCVELRFDDGTVLAINAQQWGINMDTP